MDALIKTINTYSGYDELWANGRLYIKYYGAAEHEGAVRRQALAAGGSGFRSRAAVSRLCRRVPLTLLINASSLNTLSAGSCEFLPEARDRLLPAELFFFFFFFFFFSPAHGRQGAWHRRGYLRSCAHIPERRFAAWRGNPEPLQELQPRTAFLDDCCATSLKFVSSPSTTHMTARSARLSALWRKERADRIFHSLVRRRYGRFALRLQRRCFAGAFHAARRRHVHSAVYRTSPAALFYKFKINGEHFLCADDDGHSSRASAQAARVFASRCISAASKRLRNSAAASCIRFFPTALVFPTTALRRQALNITAASGKRRKCTEA